MCCRNKQLLTIVNLKHKHDIETMENQFEKILNNEPFPEAQAALA
jgi:hypothetical protein